MACRAPVLHGAYTAGVTIQRGSGDPVGRRIARRRNRVLAEASRAGRAFEALLRRAGLDAPELAPLLARLADEEERELMRGAGRLESRKRFKHRSGQPLQEHRAADLLFLDESGTAHPQVPEPCFVLGGIAMAEEEADAYRARADALKMEFFGRTDITFHEPHVRNHHERFSLGGSADRQRALCEAIDELVATTPFRLFGVAVRKHAFSAFVGGEEDPYIPPDLYAVAIQLLLERYVDYLATRGDNPMGRVTFESVGPREDAEHQREYADLLLHGTQWVPDSAFRNWLIAGLRLHAQARQRPDGARRHGLARPLRVDARRLRGVHAPSLACAPTLRWASSGSRSSPTATSEIVSRHTGGR